MKIELEKNIPAFRGKTFLEKQSLRQRARNLDPWIARLDELRLALIPIITISALHKYPNLLDAHIILFPLTILIVVALVDFLMRAFFVTHRIRVALSTDSHEAA
jgi:hypothetical protein